MLLYFLLQASLASIGCDMCQYAVGKLQQQIVGQTLFWDGFDEFVALFCGEFTDYNHLVCIDTIKEMTPSVIGALSERFINPEKVCKDIDACSYPQYIYQNFTDW